MADSIPQRLADASQELRQMLDAALKKDSLSVTEMFALQMKMNALSQLSELSATIMSASNSAIMSLARNIKG